MKRLRVTLIALLCVLFSIQEKISLVEVMIRVRPGDNITIHCDCEIPYGSNIIWFRNCSHDHQPSLVLDARRVFQVSNLSKRFSFVPNATTKSYGLKITNVTENDQGLYFCARMDMKLNQDGKGILVRENVYSYGNQTTRLSLIEKPCPCVTGSPNITTSTIPEWHVGWKILVAVCTGCGFLSSLISSTCVFCICMRSQKGNPDEAVKSTEEYHRHNEVGEHEVCYAMLDVENLKKKTRPRHSDCSLYSDVIMDRTETLSMISE